MKNVKFVDVISYVWTCGVAAVQSDMAEYNELKKRFENMTMFEAERLRSIGHCRHCASKQFVYNDASQVIEWARCTQISCVWRLDKDIAHKVVKNRIKMQAELDNFWPGKIAEFKAKKQKKKEQAALPPVKFDWNNALLPNVNDTSEIVQLKQRYSLAQAEYKKALVAVSADDGCFRTVKRKTGLFGLFGPVREFNEKCTAFRDGADCVNRTCAFRDKNCAYQNALGDKKKVESEWRCTVFGRQHN